jgi:hypothetical protein
MRSKNKRYKLIEHSSYKVKLIFSELLKAFKNEQNLPDD